MKNNKPENAKKKTRKGNYRYYLLLASLFLYAILFILKPEDTLKAMKTSLATLIQIVPILLGVILFMGMFNYFINPKKLSYYLGKESGVKGWFLAVSAGVLSHGAIYVWYSLLKELREHGMRSGLAAVFLYNRAIKIPFIPVMVYYFGIKYVIVLLLYMIILSVLEGKIVEVLIDEKTH